MQAGSTKQHFTNETTMQPELGLHLLSLVPQYFCVEKCRSELKVVSNS